MIHHVTIPPETYPGLCEAATAAKMTVGEFCTWAIQDAVQNHKDGENKTGAAFMRLMAAISEGDYADMD